MHGPDLRTLVVRDPTPKFVRNPRSGLRATETDIPSTFDGNWQEQEAAPLQSRSMYLI
jgi:hypothetical protein